MPGSRCAARTSRPSPAAPPRDGPDLGLRPARQGEVPGVGLPEPDASFPLLESYIDVVLEGALEYGTDYARELHRDTSDWSRFWLNDRELAAAPGCMTPNPPPSTSSSPRRERSAHLGDRLFAEPYAIKWMSERAIGEPEAVTASDGVVGAVYLRDPSLVLSRKSVPALPDRARSGHLAGLLRNEAALVCASRCEPFASGAARASLLFDSIS